MPLKLSLLGIPHFLIPFVRLSCHPHRVLSCPSMQGGQYRNINIMINYAEITVYTNDTQALLKVCFSSFPYSFYPHPRLLPLSLSPFHLFPIYRLSLQCDDSPHHSPSPTHDPRPAAHATAQNGGRQSQSPSPRATAI